MNYDQYLRAVTNPYWCKDPLSWQADGVGISYFAQEGHAGLFNLCWLVLQQKSPPPADVYRNTNLTWVIQLSGGTMMGGRSMLQHASMSTLTDFKSVLRAFIERTRKPPYHDFPGSVPWATLHELATKKETI